MSLRGCAAVIDDLVQAYPEDVVVEQLKQVYREEIRQVIGEINERLLHYRTQVDMPTYELERAKVMLLQAWEGEGTMGVQALETSLKYLLKKQQVFSTISPPMVKA
jgi:hypothetical protein